MLPQTRGRGSRGGEEVADMGSVDKRSGGSPEIEAKKEKQDLSAEQSLIAAIARKKPLI